MTSFLPHTAQCPPQPSPSGSTLGLAGPPRWGRQSQHQQRLAFRAHAKQAKRKKRGPEPVQEDLDWLQSDLLALPEQAGRDQLTEEDKRKLLLCLLPDEDLDAEGADEGFDLLDEERDQPDDNDVTRQRLVDRFNSPALIRYFPEDMDPRLDWMNDNKIKRARVMPHFSTWQEDQAEEMERLAVQSARDRAEELSLEHRARGASQYRLANVMAKYMDDIDEEDRRQPSESPWDLPVWVRAVLRTEENWAELEARARLEDGDPDLVADWYSKQPSGVYGQDVLLGDKDDQFKPDDLFLRGTLPGAAAEGSPDYVEPPDEGELVEEKDVQLLPEPIYADDDLPEPEAVRERFLAGKKLSRRLTPLRPVGGEGLHEKD